MKLLQHQVSRSVNTIFCHNHKHSSHSSSHVDTCTHTKKHGSPARLMYASALAKSHTNKRQTDTRLDNSHVKIDGLQLILALPFQPSHALPAPHSCVPEPVNSNELHNLDMATKWNQMPN
jgi:hypothetical protein